MPVHVPTLAHIREHGQLFGEQAKAVIGVEGFLGVVALFEFVKSFLHRPTHLVLMHGHIVKQPQPIHPSWGWLSIALGVALFAETTVVHRLLRERDGTGKISMTTKQLADFGKHMQAKES
jgi:hypothetical protein